jgi:hypothetical protein
LKSEQYIFKDDVPDKNFGPEADLVLLFGSPEKLNQHGLINKLKSVYLKACIMGCSTAGEIINTQVLDDSLIVTAVSFRTTRIKSALVNITDAGDSYKAGTELAKSLSSENLRHIFVLSEGLKINGSELVRGLKEHLANGITLTGGLSADGDRFEETYVVLNNDPVRNAIAAIGFYGNDLRIGYGSFGGWDTFGPERIVTRSSGNILFELDGKSALTLYKQYLGEHADGLPATGLVFPLNLRTRDSLRPVVRTLLGVNEEDQSMTFAGEIPQNSYVRLMKANNERLIDGAADAARASYETIGWDNIQLAILISCIGRKLVLKQRTEEEIEAVRDILGNNAFYTGFYSYGEISPFSKDDTCELHNQTMTITCMYEV